MSQVFQRTKGSELEDIDITWYDPAGAIRDFSAGWTFAIRIGTPGQAALVEPSAAGAATAPNLTISFAAGALDTIPAGSYHLDVTPRFTGTSQDLTTRTWLFQVLDNVLAAAP
jgi:hypothetical protein